MRAEFKFPVPTQKDECGCTHISNPVLWGVRQEDYGACWQLYFSGKCCLKGTDRVTEQGA